MPSAKSTKKKTHITRVPMACSLLSLGVMSALLLAAAIVIWQDQSERQTQKNAFDQRLLLQRVSELEQRWARIAGCVSSADTSIGRTEAKSLMPNGPEGVWNMAEATSTVEFRDEIKGIGFRIPYNPIWGNATYKVSPFEIVRPDNEPDKVSISFGPLAYMCAEGCNWGRAITLSIIPSRTEKQAIDDFAKIGTSISTERLTIGGFQILQMSVGTEFGVEFVRTEFAGKRYNYIFTSSPSITAVDNKIIEGILKTLRSI